MENDEGEKAAEPGPTLQTQPLCRFFSQGRHCNFGKKCRFLHVRDDSRVHEQKTVWRPSRSDVGPSSSNPDIPQRNADHHRAPPGPANSRSGPPGTSGSRRTCRYFMSGHCTMEDRCRFWHPPQLPPVVDDDCSGAPPSVPSSVHTGPVQQRRTTQPLPPPVVPRPGVLQEVKLCDLTEEVAKQLRDTEIKQLKKRFPKDQLIVQERSDGGLTYYRVTVEATDPDWPFDLKEVDVMVSFPDAYPLEIFTLDIPLDQDLPPVMGRHVEQASLEWLQAKHATNQLLGKLELLFRPFLRWLDRSLERLFTEGARQLKKDVDLERSGLQFISYQELQATVCEKSSPDTVTEDGDDDDDEGDEEQTKGQRTSGGLEGPCRDGGWQREKERGMEEEEEEDEEAAIHRVENIKISDPRRGTEVKLLGLRLGENTATVSAQRITVCLQCNRCKVTADLTLTGRSPCTAQCEKCNASIGAAFRPSMLHHYCDVLGYLDLQSATPSDLVLQDCDLSVGCLACSQDGTLQNVSYGQTRDFNCEHCHEKLSILVESARFQFIPPRVNKTGPSASTVNYKTIRDPAVQKGKPLPEKGACKHYKQSHRWLRFPCCGRAYPCDVCHDEDQDHHMELATRMICGFCAKEQPYGNGKPCVSCGSMMTRGAFTSHWEGGLGCRNRTKMNRNDRQKYANVNKTISRKAAAEKK